MSWYGLNGLCVGLLDEEPLSSTSHCVQASADARDGLEAGLLWNVTLTWKNLWLESLCLQSFQNCLTWGRGFSLGKISDLRQNVFTFATISVAAVFTSSFNGLTWYLDCKYGIWLGGKWPTLVRMLDFLRPSKNCASGCNCCKVWLQYDVGGKVWKSSGSQEFPWKRVHGKDSVWWHGSQETQKETQQWYELEYREALKGTWESIEVIGVQGVASLSPLHSTDYAKSTPGSLNAVTQFLHSAGGPYPYVSPEFWELRVVLGI